MDEKEENKADDKIRFGFGSVRFGEFGFDYADTHA
jgi:hypothetical protein